MKLGVDTYSIRSQGWDAFGYLEYSRRIGLDIVHFSDMDSFESFDVAYLRRVKARADELGLTVEAGMGSICPTSTGFHSERGTAAEQVTRLINAAAVLGSPVVRCFLGSSADRRSALPLEAHIQATVDTCHAVRDLCRDKGVKLAIENHAGDLQGREMKELIERAGPETVGVCLDNGNPLWTLEDPMVTLEYLAPYTITSHVRDTSVWPHPRGAAVQWVAMGDGNTGLNAWIAGFKVRCPQAPVTLEIITGGAPRVMPYLEPDFWGPYRGVLAFEFARFEKLVREGQPFLGTMLTAGHGPDLPAEYRAALIVQQRVDLERSVRYCKEELGLGES
jgi:sugar phosphate isomerase/epimerase